MQTNAATSAAEGKRRCSEHSGASARKVQSGKGGLGLNPGAAPLFSLFPMALHCVLCGHQAVPCPGNAFRGRIVSLAQTYIKKWTTIAISASQLILTCYKFCTSEMLLQRAPETRAGCDTFAPSSAERCKCAGATTPGGELPQVLASVALVREPRADTILGLLLVQPLAKPPLAQQCRLCPASAHHLFQTANAITMSCFGEVTAKYFGFCSSFCASLRHLSPCYSQPTLGEKKKKKQNYYHT